MQRLFALIITTCALILLGLPIIFLALMVRYNLGSPIFFRQMRAGLKGRPFELVKFRTMTNARLSDGSMLEDNERITKFGRFLRTTSLDELPSFWNVLIGDMNLVGPRPLLIEYLPHYTLEQGRRHEIRPGITGWAQVNGRNSISWNEKFKLDIWYIDNQNILLDIKILWLTLIKVIIRDGISPSNEEIMPKFTKDKT
jgi:lipopolysaccharide/colanic/teichoic acid biosynthesis glycosyltransferase